MIGRLFEGLTPLIPSLKSEKRPIFLYGMGDGAEKINAYLAAHGIVPEGVAASADFVRGQSFLGKKVVSVESAVAQRGECCFVLCFGLEEDRHAVLDPIVKSGSRVVSPDIPVFGPGAKDAEFIKANEARFERLFSMLADGLSARVLEAVLRYDYTGDPYMLELENADEPPEGFYDRDGIHIDVGAYDGDTAVNYIERGGKGEVYAFEPDKASFRRLAANAARYKRIKPYNLLVGDVNGKTLFSSGRGRASHAGEGNGEVDCVTVDGFFGFTNTASAAPPVASIKIDAEGMDERVICGAANTIYCCRTNVCAAVYHRVDDLLTIPFLLKAYDQKYKFHLRKKACVPAWDVFLYAARDI